MNAGLHVKYLLFSSGCNLTWISWTNFRKNTPISKFIQVRRVVAELKHMDGQTNRHDEANSRF